MRRTRINFCVCMWMDSVAIKANLYLKRKKNIKLLWLNVRCWLWHAASSYRWVQIFNDTCPILYVTNNIWCNMQGPQHKILFQDFFLIFPILLPLSLCMHVIHRTSRLRGDDFCFWMFCDIQLTFLTYYASRKWHKYNEVFSNWEPILVWLYFNVEMQRCIRNWLWCALQWV